MKLFRHPNLALRPRVRAFFFARLRTDRAGEILGLPVQFLAQSVAFCDVVALLALHGVQHSESLLERF